MEQVDKIIQFRLPQRALTGLDKTDAMPAGLRACVHEFGFAIVDAFVTLGITNPRHIRHLVVTCWQGARSPIDSSRTAPGSALLGQIDWLMIQAGAGISAKTLSRVLFQSGFAIAPLSPSDRMVDASIEATGEMGLVSKREKHRGRLAAALRASAVRTFPHLFAEARR